MNHRSAHIKHQSDLSGPTLGPTLALYKQPINTVVSLIRYNINYMCDMYNVMCSKADTVQLRDSHNTVFITKIQIDKS